MYPPLHLEKSKSGHANICWHGKYLHSQIDPIKESKREYGSLPQAKCYILIGPGVGYLADLIFQAKIQLILIEPNPSLASQYTGQSEIITGNDWYPALHKLFESNQLPVNPRVIIPNGMVRARPELIEIKNTIGIMIRENFTNISTTKHFEILWCKHIIENWILIKQQQYEKISPLIKNRTVIICGAGPSLTETDIRKYSRNRDVVITCVDTALPTLLAMNITPKLVFSLDTQWQNYSDFTLGGSPDKSITLVADISTNPLIARHWQGNIIWFNSNIQVKSYQALVALINGDFKNYKLPVFKSGGSVMCQAIDCLTNNGAGKIIMIGQDMAWKIGLSHCRNSHYHILNIHSSNRIHTALQKSCLNTSNHSVEKISKDYYTNKYFLAVKKWMEQYITLAKSKDSSHFNLSFSPMILSNWININNSDNDAIKNILNPTKSEGISPALDTSTPYLMQGVLSIILEIVTAFPHKRSTPSSSGSGIDVKISSTIDEEFQNLTGNLFLSRSEPEQNAILIMLRKALKLHS